MFKQMTAFLALAVMASQAGSRERPGKSDLVFESLSGFAGGVAGAYLGGVAGAWIGPRRDKSLDMTNFVMRAAVGYPLGTAAGIYGYSALGGWKGIRRPPS